MGNFPEGKYDDVPELKTYTFGIDNSKVRYGSQLQKLKYFTTISHIKQVIEEYKPDIVHAHRVSSYGLVGALAGYKPLVISVWGDDVYDFPNRSFIHRAAVKGAFRRATKVLSTSRVMARETMKYTSHPVYETPFGVDLEVFRPRKVDSRLPEDSIVIGTVTTMETKYGIDILIKAFHKVTLLHPDLPLHLLLVGTGSKLDNYQALATSLSIADRVTFTGQVPFEQVIDYHNMIDVFAALSVYDAESFGVSIIEAGACEKPVVVSNAGGPAEVVDHGTTGYIVPKHDVQAAADAIARLAVDAQLRETLGKNARAHVARLYDWNDNVKRMIAIYRAILSDTDVPFSAVTA